MEHSSEPNIKKILIDFSEYERLKHIESKYIELQNHQKKESFNQIGKGNPDSNDDEEDDDDDNISNNLYPPYVTKESKIKHFPSVNYDSQITKNDLNDAFDENRLLALIPKRFRKNAKTLLTEFNKRADEITWNSSGTIFINQTALPSSNIYIFFPLLFKKQPPKVLGFNEFLQKIKDMGLSDLVLTKAQLDSYETNNIITHDPLTSKKIENPNDFGSGSKDLISPKSEKQVNIPWWYIGD